MSVQLVVASGSRAGQVIPIIGERFVVGRAEDCNLKPRSELISRYHCEFFSEGGDVFVRDMGSKNGVFLNDEQITETRELKNGDKVAFGPLEFFVHLAVESQPQPVPEQKIESIPESKPSKVPRVKSVSDAVARTVALQSEHSQKSTEDTITDWLLTAGEGGDDLETRIIDTSELMAHLNAQSAEAAAHLEKEKEDSSMQPGGSTRSGSPASSRDAASELLRKFFKGGK
jgi:pSer/pThr/pTyr-binding forkhead associated (FHA) protein